MTSIARLTRLAVATTILATPLSAQGLDNLRAGVGRPAPVVESHTSLRRAPLAAGDSALLLYSAAVPLEPLSSQRQAETSDGGVSRRSLAIGAAVGAVAGAIGGIAAYRQTDFTTSEAWPLFAGIAGGVGALIGAGIGMAVVAWVLPN